MYCVLVQQAVDNGSKITSYSLECDQVMCIILLLLLLLEMNFDLGGTVALLLQDHHTVLL